MVAMRKLLTFLIALALAVAGSESASAVPVWMLDGPMYVGPRDINGTAFAFWSTHCINKAYSGNVMDITDTATGTTTGTRLVCNNGVVSALVSGSACTFVTGPARLCSRRAPPPATCARSTIRAETRIAPRPAIKPRAQTPTDRFSCRTARTPASPVSPTTAVARGTCAIYRRTSLHRLLRNLIRLASSQSATAAKASETAIFLVVVLAAMCRRDLVFRQIQRTYLLAHQRKPFLAPMVSSMHRSISSTPLPLPFTSMGQILRSERRQELTAWTMEARWRPAAIIAPRTDGQMHGGSKLGFGPQTRPPTMPR